MAKVVFEYPDNLASKIVEAFKAKFNYQAEIPNPENKAEKIANPVGEREFATQQVVNFVKQVVLEHQSRAFVSAVRAELDAADIKVSIE